MGVIFTVAMLIWMAFERMMGWHDKHIDQHATVSMIFAVIAIAIYVSALLDKRNNDLNGTMTWSQGFVSGYWITMVIVVLSPVAQLLTHTIITPDFFNNIIAYTVQSGHMTLEEAESYFSMSSYLIQSAGGALALGIFTSAVVALFTKRKDQQ